MRKDETVPLTYDQTVVLGALSCVIHDSAFGSHVDSSSAKTLFTSASPYGISCLGGIGRSISIGVTISGMPI